MKRERSVTDTDSTRQSRLRADELPLVEEIVTVEETQSVLIRLPCLDFFRDAHVCERAADTACGCEAPTEGGEEGVLQFAPDAFTVKSGTLETPHPVVVLHSQQYGEIVFEGSWCELNDRNVSAAPLSNHVVVQLCEKGDEQPAKGGASTNNNSSSSSISSHTNEPRISTDKKSTATGIEVASLLKHPSVGITADDARGLQKARNASWAYGRIDVPCATLVLRRVG
ncbi:hypothetical protein DQ04_00981090 [Trypanosoma grayi]|uniref:hypothetical protein n=1 Tax=Trypanosoma grayi TaxID=71804 RepID=UPI0004F48DB6|nr:hypothetical protein DQ04_00981090 [Trypanosoma grayi]KEG13479.1 hypothetical protein DQ04_00981090 [Trypanosoma grayi]